MRKNESSGKQEIVQRLKGSFVAAVAAILATIVLMLILSIMVQHEVLPQNIMELGPVVLAALMTFIAAAITVKRMGGKTFISGISVAAAVLVLILLAGVMGYQEGMSLSIWMVLGIVIGGVLAGLMGGRKHKIR